MTARRPSLLFRKLLMVGAAVGAFMLAWKSRPRAEHHPDREAARAPSLLAGRSLPPPLTPFQPAGLLLVLGAPGCSTAVWIEYASDFIFRSLSEIEFT